MEKKSLISTLLITKKANVVTAPAKNEGTTSRKAAKKASVRIGKFRNPSRLKM